VVRDGKINVPGSDFNIEGTEGDPAALISVYEQVTGGWKKTDTQVGHKLSTLTKIDPLPAPPPEEKAKPKRGSRKRG
jgi:hypothetical protein